MKTMKVMVVTHPVNTKVFEVLFSTGDKFLTLDGLSDDCLLESGMSIHTVLDLSGEPHKFYRLMAKSLAEKIKFLDYHVKYIDRNKYLNLFKRLAAKLVYEQCNTFNDLDLPEVVQSLANCA